MPPLNQPSLIATLGEGSGVSPFAIARSLTEDERRFFAMYNDGSLVECDVATLEERWKRLYPDHVAKNAVFVGPRRDRLVVASVERRADGRTRGSVELWKLTALDEGPRALVVEDRVEAQEAFEMSLAPSPDGAWLVATLSDPTRALLFATDDGSAHGVIPLDRRTLYTPLALLSDRLAAFVEGSELVFVQDGVARVVATFDERSNWPELHALSSKRLLATRKSGDDRYTQSLFAASGALIREWSAADLLTLVGAREDSFVTQAGHQIDERDLDGSLVRQRQVRPAVWLCGRETVAAVGWYVMTSTTWADAELGRWTEHATTSVTAVEWAPDGRTLVAQHRDGQVRVWDVEQQRVLRELAPPPVDGCRWDLQQLIDGGGTALFTITRHLGAYDDWPNTLEAIVAVDLADESFAERWRIEVGGDAGRVICASEDGALLIVRRRSDPRYAKPFTVIRRTADGVIARTFDHGPTQIGFARRTIDGRSTDASTLMVCGDELRRVRFTESCEMVTVERVRSVGVSCAVEPEALVGARGTLIWCVTAAQNEPRFFSLGEDPGAEFVGFPSEQWGWLAQDAPRCAFATDAELLAVFDFVSRQRWSLALDPREAPARRRGLLAISAAGDRVALATYRGEVFVYAIA